MRKIILAGVATLALSGAALAQGAGGATGGATGGGGAGAGGAPGANGSAGGAAGGANRGGTSSPGGNSPETHLLPDITNRATNTPNPVTEKDGLPAKSGGSNQGSSSSGTQ